MNLQKDLKEFIKLLNFHRVEYIIVGAYCLAYHGVTRLTEAIDIFINNSPQNAERLERVIGDFGFESTGLTQRDFLQPHKIIQLGIAPNRIQLLTGIDAVDFQEAWAARMPVKLDDLPVFMLSKELLIRNKRATGRPQDLADVSRLGEG